GSSRRSFCAGGLSPAPVCSRQFLVNAGGLALFCRPRAIALGKEPVVLFPRAPISDRRVAFDRKGRLPERAALGDIERPGPDLNRFGRAAPEPEPRDAVGQVRDRFELHRTLLRNRIEARLLEGMQFRLWPSAGDRQKWGEKRT